MEERRKERQEGRKEGREGGRREGGKQAAWLGWKGERKNGWDGRKDGWLPS